METNSRAGNVRRKNGDMDQVPPMECYECAFREVFKGRDFLISDLSSLRSVDLVGLKITTRDPGGESEHATEQRHLPVLPERLCYRKEYRVVRD